MTKSITATYFGILQKQGKIDIMKPAPIAEWQDDARKKITINDLLHMNSGLEWEEQYDKISDATKMLFQAEDMGKVQAEKLAVFEPNMHWHYSSGTTNLLSGILRKQFKTHQEYLDFWYSSLLDKIGMHSALIETDMAGNFVGSSYGWATTRDWAKFGLLYLHQGNWNGEQIFNPSWANYVATPTNTSNGQYGAQFWLNAGGKYPDVPRDLYHCNGYQGQMVFIIPSEDLVIVRMGLSEGLDYNAFLREVIASLKKN
jgi:CubicO group peptidase (beta-lactamase class C family)